MIAGIVTMLDWVFTFIEALGIFYLVNTLLGQRFGSDKRYGWGILGGCVIGYVAIVKTLNQIALTSPYTVIICMIFCMIATLIFWKSNLVSASAVVGGYFMVLTAVSLAEISVVGLIGGDELIEKCCMETGIERLTMIIICGLIWITLCFSVARWMYIKGSTYGENRRVMITLVMGFLGGVYLCREITFGFELATGIIGYLFIGILAGVLGLWYYQSQMGKLSERNRMLDYQNTVLEQKYEELNEFYTSNAKTYHDLKHHLYAVHTMLEMSREDEAKAYIESLTTPIQSMPFQSWTGVDLIDTILTDKIHAAGKKNVKMTVDAQILAPLSRIEKKDICSVFANILDNAVEAAESEISVAIKSVHEMMLFQVENDFKVAPVRKDGRFQTVKADKRLHGWGLINVEMIVKKYSGSIDFKVEKKRFKVRILMNK